MVNIPTRCRCQRQLTSEVSVPQPKKQHNKIVGDRYELLARDYLEKKGLKFITQHVCYRGAELDLVMQQDSCWVFIEVRYRHNDHHGDAASTISPDKRKRLIYAATRYLASRRLDIYAVECRFDVIAITGDKLLWLPSAFND